MPQVSKPGKNSRFSLCYVLNNCTAIAHRIRRTAAALHSANLEKIIHGIKPKNAKRILETRGIRAVAELYATLLPA